VRLQPPTVVEPLVLEFRHPPLQIRFRFEMRAGLTTPVDLCLLVNRALSQVLPQGRLLDWDSQAQRLGVRLKLNQCLLVDQLEVYNWFRLAPEDCGLVPGTVLPGWSSHVGPFWSSTDWNPMVGKLIHELRVTRSPLADLSHLSVGITLARPMVVHMALWLPEDWAVKTIDMSHVPFNPFYRDDPANTYFKDHLAAQIADLMAAPPLLTPQWGVFFPTRLSNWQVAWVNPNNRSPLAVSIRLTSFFWKSYLLPQHLMGLETIKLERLAEVHPHRQGEDKTVMTLSPYPNPGQSFHPPPFALCSELLGDNFLRPDWSYPCLGLIEPTQAAFQVLHQPFLRLEGIEGLARQTGLYLLDGNGRRIWAGPGSRVWVELSSF